MSKFVFRLNTYEKRIAIHYKSLSKHIRGSLHLTKPHKEHVFETQSALSSHYYYVFFQSRKVTKIQWRHMILKPAFQSHMCETFYMDFFFLFLRQTWPHSYHTSIVLACLPLFSCVAKKKRLSYSWLTTVMLSFLSLCFSVLSFLSVLRRSLFSPLSLSHSRFSLSVLRSCLCTVRTRQIKPLFLYIQIDFSFNWFGLDVNGSGRNLFSGQTLFLKCN